MTSLPLSPFKKLPQELKRDLQVVYGRKERAEKLRLDLKEARGRLRKMLNLFLCERSAVRLGDDNYLLEELTFRHALTSIGRRLVSERLGRLSFMIFSSCCDNAEKLLKTIESILVLFGQENTHSKMDPLLALNIGIPCINVDDLSLLEPISNEMELVFFGYGQNFKIALRTIPEDNVSYDRKAEEYKFLREIDSNSLPESRSILKLIGVEANFCLAVQFLLEPAVCTLAMCFDPTAVHVSVFHEGVDINELTTAFLRLMKGLLEGAWCLLQSPGNSVNEVVSLFHRRNVFLCDYSLSGASFEEATVLRDQRMIKHRWNIPLNDLHIKFCAVKDENVIRNRGYADKKILLRELADDILLVMDLTEEEMEVLEPYITKYLPIDTTDWQFKSAIDQLEHAMRRGGVRYRTYHRQRAQTFEGKFNVELLKENYQFDEGKLIVDCRTSEIKFSDGSHMRDLVRFEEIRNVKSIKFRDASVPESAMSSLMVQNGNGESFLLRVLDNIRDRLYDMISNVKRTHTYLDECQAFYVDRHTRVIIPVYEYISLSLMSSDKEIDYFGLVVEQKLKEGPRKMCNCSDTPSILYITKEELFVEKLLKISPNNGLTTWRKGEQTISLDRKDIRCIIIENFEVGYDREAIKFLLCSTGKPHYCFMCQVRQLWDICSVLLDGYSTSITGNEDHEIQVARIPRSTALADFYVGKRIEKAELPIGEGMNVLLEQKLVRKAIIMPRGDVDSSRSEDAPTVGEGEHMIVMRQKHEESVVHTGMRQRDLPVSSGCLTVSTTSFERFYCTVKSRVLYRHSIKDDTQTKATLNDDYVARMRDVRNVCDYDPSPVVLTCSEDCGEETELRVYVGSKEAAYKWNETVRTMNGDPNMQEDGTLPKDGWFVARARNGKASWKKQFFVINNNYLRYYCNDWSSERDARLPSPQGELDLTNVTEIVVRADSPECSAFNSRPAFGTSFFSLEIKQENGSVLYCHSCANTNEEQEKDLERWKKSIEKNRVSKQMRSSLTVFEGWIVKRARRGVRNWKRRFLALGEGMLRYYRTERDSSFTLPAARGKIDLQNVLGVEYLEADSKECKEASNSNWKSYCALRISEVGCKPLYIHSCGNMPGVVQNIYTQMDYMKGWAQAIQHAIELTSVSARGWMIVNPERRYFHLENGKLTMYDREEDDNNPLEVIHCDQIVNVESLYLGTLRLGLRISYNCMSGEGVSESCSLKQLHLYANTEEEQRGWKLFLTNSR